MNSFMMDIKNNSNDLHAVAEKTGFLKRLLEGKASTESYAEYLYNLYEVYNAIEVNLEKCKDNKVVKDFVLPEIYRAEAILKDLKFLLGENLNTMKPLASTRAYVARINEIGETAPELLVAHAYTRYLADLFGGRTIYGMVKDLYKIDEEGLNYYKYETLSDEPEMKGFVMNYHNKLNNIELNEEIKERFINEVANSYVYNIAISNELDFIRFNR
ncbi:TPA: biliverdin-producing heme oxygenase [Clostridium perfringens]|uniref:biliverdin-producing heme oxygenase n=1 Tax=Clostridium perfringens TaxID=1502 RepID=UPI0013E2E83A|nr:biliverdin-producing heme oxygenase [Clostridium perfringens]EJT5939806.1 biliverdin-producing heme oxygenase [Clostridium perfringens]EJT6471895.1 biliverdin-producing heme oxygenase [Clostridium perfringens]NGT78306.1 biliverdin-producing heme oxygenase [Clostridium perfringens]WFB45030.1 biliverdin-producing heme oxygenase [Clostridium perfringens]WFD76599.1 biliverdin-producing heme oxygenase [Clostridium perfringens]